jgi:hypothetical protein
MSIIATSPAAHALPSDACPVTLLAGDLRFVGGVVADVFGVALRTAKLNADLLALSNVSPSGDCPLPLPPPLLHIVSSYAAPPADLLVADKSEFALLRRVDGVSGMVSRLSFRGESWMCMDSRDGALYTVRNRNGIEYIPREALYKNSLSAKPTDARLLVYPQSRVQSHGEGRYRARRVDDLHL